MAQIIGFFETFHPVRHLLFAILILGLGHGLIKFATHWLELAMARAQVEPTVTRFLTHVSYVILLTVVAIIALGQLGIQTTSLLVMLSAAGLAIGLALQGSLTKQRTSSLTRGLGWCRAVRAPGPGGAQLARGLPLQRSPRAAVVCLAVRAGHAPPHPGSAEGGRDDGGDHGGAEALRRPGRASL